MALGSEDTRKLGILVYLAAVERAPEPVYPEDVWTVFAERFVVPFKLLAAWISS